MGLFDWVKKKEDAPKTIILETKKQVGSSEIVPSCQPRYAYTPERISELQPNEVFVFGSNLAGRHGGGAARAAVSRFGAIWGQGVGMQGQSYAIPTMQGDVETIKPYVDEFIEYAKSHTDKIFFVTRIGCGIAGFKDKDIAPLFAAALNVKNIVLPRSFADCLKAKATMKGL